MDNRPFRELFGFLLLALLIAIPIPSQSQNRNKDAITITPKDLKNRFSDEVRKTRQRLAREVERYNSSLPPESQQTSDDVRRWAKLVADLDDAAKRAAWDEHEDIVISAIKKPGKAAVEAFRRELEEAEKKRQAEQERVRRELMQAQELQLKQAQINLQAAQLQAQLEQTKALERQAAALEEQAEQQRRTNNILLGLGY
jgi:hypothetical protein